MLRSDQLDFANRLQDLIRSLVRCFERCEAMCLAQQGVTVSQAYTLLALPPDGRVTMSELSEAMGLAGSTMTRMMDTLVRKGLARRTHDEQDRRVVWVELSPKGQQQRRRLQKAQEEFLQAALGGVGEEEQARIVETLERVNASLKLALGSDTGCGPG